MVEVTPGDEAPQAKQEELSQVELAPHVQRLSAEFRSVLSTIPEFNQAAGQHFLNKNRIIPRREIQFQLGNSYYEVDADRTGLCIERAQDLKELMGGEWLDREGRDSEYVFVIFPDRIKDGTRNTFELCYKGPELTTPTPGFIMPTNTGAVIEKIEKFLAEFKAQVSAAR